MPDADRARLGARMAAFAEPAVRDAWGKLNTAAMQGLRWVSTEAGLIKLRMDIGRSMEQLERAIGEAMSEG